MPRRPRVLLADYPLHIVQRGINREPCFFTHALYQQLGPDSAARQAAYRSLFRTELEDAAAKDIRMALQLGMPVGSARFAEAVCVQLGIRHNSGQRGRPNLPNEAGKILQPTTGQSDFGF